jgi:hypothetical protein
MEPQSPAELLNVSITVPIEHMNRELWAMQRSMAIAGTSFSAALALVVMQIGLVGSARSIALFCACLALPTWVTFWRVGETYFHVGADARGHFSTFAGSGFHNLLGGVAGTLLIVAFASLAWSFSAISSIAFIFASICSVVVVYVHLGSVPHGRRSKRATEPNYSVNRTLTRYAGSRRLPRALDLVVA